METLCKTKHKLDRPVSVICKDLYPPAGAGAACKWLADSACRPRSHFQPVQVIARAPLLRAPLRLLQGCCKASLTCGPRAARRLAALAPLQSWQHC